jgi:hypothetical protein
MMGKRSTRMMIEDGQKGENTPALPAVLKGHKQTAKEHSSGMLRFFMGAHAFLLHHYRLRDP